MYQVAILYNGNTFVQMCVCFCFCFFRSKTAFAKLLFVSNYKVNGYHVESEGRLC